MLVRSLARLLLQLHQPSTTACSLYSALSNARAAGTNQFPTWPGGGMPFLNYGGSGGSSAALSADVLPRVMSFNRALETGTSDRLWFVLAKFALNGTFVGLERLTSQFLYCGASSGAGSSTDSGLPPWLQFGYGTTISAACSLTGISLAPEPFFYDLYVRDLSADQSAIDARSGTLIGSGDTAVRVPMTLYPVPVRITNYRDAGGSQPNVNTNRAAESNDVLTTR
jgi:hypothetical protein